MEGGKPLQAAAGFVVIFLRSRRAVGHSIQTGLEAARGQAASWVQDGAAREAFIGKAVASLEGKVLYWLTERVEAVSLSKFWEDGLEAIEVWKAEVPSPLNPAGFDILVDQLTQKLGAVADPFDTAAIKRAMNVFEGAGTPEQMAEAANRALANLMTVPPIIDNPQSAILKNQGGVISLKTKKGLVDKYEFGMKATLSAYDDRVTKYLSSTHANFVRDEYGNRSVAMSKQAKAIIGKMEAEGRSVKDMQEALAEQLGTSNVLRSRAYWRGVSNVFVNRSRTYTAFGTYQEASVTLFEVVAVMDEATTDVCRFMDGKVLDLNSALANFGAVENLADPMGVKTENPFIRQVKAGPATFLALKIPNAEAGKPPTVRPVAQVTESGFGTQGKGSYNARMDDAALQQNGVHGPPYHVNCRTTTVPVIKTYRSPKQVPREAAVPPTPSLEQGEALDEAVTRREKDIDGFSGAAFTVDETDIEGQEIQMRREVIDDEAFYVTRFKLTEHAGARLQEAASKIPGAASSTYSLNQSELSEMVKGKVKKKKDRVESFSSILFTLDGARINQVTKKGSFQNLVEVRVKAANPRAAFQTYKRAMGSWGVKSPGSLPTAAASDVAKKSAIIGRWKPARLAPLGDRLAKAKHGTEVEVINKYWDEVKTPEMEASFRDAELREVFPGHLSYYSKAQAAQMKNVPYLAHSVSSLEGLKFLSDPRPGFGGLKSSNYRFQQGLTFKGMSTDRDFETGGADGAFLRLANKNRGIDLSSNRTVIVDSEVLGRMDWWAYGGDRFGNTERRTLGDRLSVMDVKTKAGADTLDSSNEVMFRAGVPLEAFKGVIVRNSAEREAVKKHFLDMKITKINGKPLDKFFVALPRDIAGVIAR
jgi:hypothetical protein